MIRSILDIIAPKKCYGCKQKGSYLCEDCVKKLSLQSSYCYICKKSSHNYALHAHCKKQYQHLMHLDQIFVWTHYRQSCIKKVIHDLKFYGKYRVIEDLAPHLVSLVKNHINPETTFISFSPMHFLRKWRRGYNHSELLARQIGHLLEIPVIPLFKKVKRTKQQSKLSFSQRRSNLQGSCEIINRYANSIVGKDIIIIDDVISTGSTLRELAQLLKKAGVKKVDALLIASD